MRCTLTDIVVDAPIVEVTNSTYIEVDSGPVSTEITKASDIEVIGSKQEYSIVGDTLYASISADSAPDWLTSIIDSTVATGLNAGLQDLQSANASLVAAVGEMEVAKNEYKQLINIDSTVDASVVSHLGTLNSTVAQNSASIVTLDVGKVTADQATAIALAQISAELGTTGGIGAEVTRIDSAVAALDQAYSTSIDTLTATYQSTNTDLAVTSGAVSTLSTIVTVNKDITDSYEILLADLATADININNSITNLALQVDNKIEYWFQDTDPSMVWLDQPTKDKHNKDVWYDSSSKLSYSYDSISDTWLPIEDQKSLDAIAAASNAQATADGKITTYYGTLIATVGEGVGDLLVASDEGNKLYRWTGTNWSSAQDTSISAVASDVTDLTASLDSGVGTWSTADSTLENSLNTTINNGLASVESKFSYNSTLAINGQYYTSGFGLDTSGTYGGTGTELDPFSSEFWINAKEFVVKDGATEYIRWNGTVLEVSGDIVGANITGSTVTGGLVRTATSGKRVELDSVSNTVLSYDNAGNTITSLGLANMEVEGAFLDTFLTIDTTYDVVRTIGAFVKTNDIGIMVRGEANATAIRGIDCKVVNYVETSGYNSIGSTSKSRNISLGLCVGSSITAEQYGTGNSMVYGTLCTALAGSLSGGTKTVYGGYFAGNTIGGTLGTSYGIYSIGGTYDFYAAGIGANYGPFTGAHDGLVKIGSNYTPGDIVQDGKHIASKGVSDTIFTSILPISCNTPAIGVVVGVESFMIPAALSIKKKLTNEQIEDGAEPEELGTLPDGYSVIQFNALGEGQINVCGEGGDLANGDLIVTSSTPGKGMKQADNIVRNYTVAKVRGDWTFSSPDEIKQIPCIYLCG